MSTLPILARANHWLFPVSNKSDFTIPVDIKAVTDIVLKSQSQLQLASEISETSPDYFICVILILEDTLVVSMCCLILSDSPVPTAELYLPELLSVEIPTLTFCRRHWAQLASAVLDARSPTELEDPALLLHGLSQHDKALVLDRLNMTCCAEPDNKDGVEVEEKKDHPLKLVKGK